MQRNTAKEGILKYFDRKLAKTRRAFTFNELYSEFEHFSKQNIRNTIYRLITDGIIERIPKSEVWKKDKVKNAKVYFRLKKRF